MPENRKINYIEMPTQDLKATKKFFTEVFGFEMTDYGDGYSSFGTEAGIDGGFYQAEKGFKNEEGIPLIIFYASSLQDTKTQIKKNGGKITRDVFSFPGGCRFHFQDPAENVFAVWSEQDN